MLASRQAQRPRGPQMTARPRREALAAMMTAVRGYVGAHPGRYAATIDAEFTGPDDPLQAAGTRVINSIAAVLRGYGIAENEMNHAIRILRSTMHGFAMLEASPGLPLGRRPGRALRVDGRFHRPRPAAQVSQPA